MYPYLGVVLAGRTPEVYPGKIFDGHFPKARIRALMAVHGGMLPTNLPWSMPGGRSQPVPVFLGARFHGAPDDLPGTTKSILDL
jgi:hypothetical protein